MSKRTSKQLVPPSELIATGIPKKFVTAVKAEEPASFVNKSDLEENGVQVDTPEEIINRQLESFDEALFNLENRANTMRERGFSDEAKACDYAASALAGQRAAFVAKWRGTQQD